MTASGGQAPHPAHIAWADDLDRMVVWCDRHGDVLVTESVRVAEAALAVHDLCIQVTERAS